MGTELRCKNLVREVSHSASSVTSINVLPANCISTKVPSLAALSAEGTKVGEQASLEVSFHQSLDELEREISQSVKGGSDFSFSKSFHRIINAERRRARIPKS